MLWAAATSIFELAEATNATAARKAVRVLDVGGGMSVSDGSDFQTRFRNFGSRLQFVPSRMSRCIGLAKAQDLQKGVAAAEAATEDYTSGMKK